MEKMNHKDYIIIKILKNDLLPWIQKKFFFFLMVKVTGSKMIMFRSILPIMMLNIELKKKRLKKLNNWQIAVTKLKSHRELLWNELDKSKKKYERFILYPT